MEELSITPQIAKFKEHLDIKENHRIIFSGRFGSGKTYFLKKFFEEKHEKYIQIRLAPVNYVVSGNQDIFELIKFDILFELLKLDVDHKIFEKSEIEALVKLPYFLNKNAYQIVKFIVEKSIPVGKDVVEIAEKLKDWINGFEEFAKVDEAKNAMAYLDSFKHKIGSIHEEDQFTNLICNCIKKLKQGSGNPKEVILVIDDLDRIDPEHIFRLFNIFSAHIDFEMADKTILHNKFGVDKIVFVCDIDNIMNIYHAKYGANVDFSGYINKFFSKEVFYYDFKATLRKELWRYVNSLDFRIENETLLKSYIHKDIVVYMLECMVQTKCINIRTLKDSYQRSKNFASINSGNDRASALLADHNLFPISLILDFFVTILGSYQKLYDAVSACSNDKMLKNNKHIHSYLSLMLAAFHINQNGISVNNGKYAVIIDQIHYKYSIGERDIPFILDEESATNNGSDRGFFYFLKHALDILRDKYDMYK